MAKRDKAKQKKSRSNEAPESSARPMKRRDYEAALRPLQAELCHLQSWIKKSTERVIIVFEGRDAAGKGGTIKALTERVSPRVFRTVALPAPSDREKSQLYIQRYLAHFPAGGEVTIDGRRQALDRHVMALDVLQALPVACVENVDLHERRGGHPLAVGEHRQRSAVLPFSRGQGRVRALGDVPPA